MQSTKGSSDDHAAIQETAPNRQTQDHTAFDKPQRHNSSISSRSTRGLKSRSGEWSDPEKLFTVMQKMGQQQHSQLEACTTGLQAKLEELRDLNARMEGLCSSAKELLENFGSEDARFRAEFKTQLESLERFRDERISIEALRERLRAEQEKVEDYERRIERVQLRVERQREKESVKKRVSWRVRFLWGFMAMLVILWLLATAGSDGDDMSGNAALGEPIKLAPPSSRSECDLEEFSLE